MIIVYFTDFTTDIYKDNKLLDFKISQQMKVMKSSLEIGHVSIE